MSRTAVVLFNLGGPDCPEAVRPFLFNLFNDKAIIGAPQPIRWAIAKLISTTREKAAQANYAIMGGRSPLLPETEAQARALEPSLLAELGGEVRVFIAMRYWNPFTEATAKEVAEFRPGVLERLLVVTNPRRNLRRNTIELYQRTDCSTARR